MFKDYREESRKNWGAETDVSITREQIGLGALLRIADALEKMAEPYTHLLNEATYLRERNKILRSEINRFSRKIAAYRGLLKRKKNTSKP